MKVYCCYTPAHEPLYREHFLPSMPNDVNVFAFPLPIAGTGDFLGKDFLACIGRKIRLIRESIERDRSAIIIWTDVDIIFFRSFVDDVMRIMDSGPYDIAFQKEGYGQWEDEVNAGFIAMRCNDAVRNFYEAVEKTLAENPEKNEQPVINELLGESEKLSWTMLPTTYGARSHGWPPADDLILYHANVTVGEGGVRRKIKQFSEVRSLRKIGRRNVCVVSPEVIGPRRNSGIGTHTFHLLKALSGRPEIDLTLLLTAEISVEREGGWEPWFRDEFNAHFKWLPPQPHLYSLVGWFNQWFNLRSLQVFNHLKRQNHEVIFFQDLNGDGFVCHQARNTGIAFQKTAFSTTLNGPARWAREGMKSFVDNEVDESLLHFVEGYPVRHTDILVSPSQYALNYAEKEAGWALAENRVVCPYMLELPEVEDRQEDEEAPAVIFFGRLETRKGIHLFLSALAQLHQREAAQCPRRVVFIGNHSTTPMGPSSEVIPRFFAERLPGWEYEVKSEWDQPECVAYLSKHRKSVVVLPSVAETLGYVAIECLGMGLNVIGADTGAFSEVFASEDRLFKNQPGSMADKICAAFAGELPPPASKYRAEEARVGWQRIFDKCFACAEDRSASVPAEFSAPEKVTVCIPYYNYGRYIRQQVDSIWIQTHQNFEVIMIDDGSTDPHSIRVFDELEAELGKEGGRFRFVRQTNKGLSHARNLAASMAETEFIVFCDADNISKPLMLERFLHAIRTSGADCVTCHFEKFRIEPDGTRVQLDHYTPVGACVEAGPLVDPFGDANCIIRKDVFEKLGGFRHVPMTASEDWEFFAELCLSGYRLEVIPDDLFEYREHRESNMRVSNFYDTRMRTIHPYLKRLNRWQRTFFVNAVGAWEVKLREKREMHERLAALEDELRNKNESIRELKRSSSWSMAAARKLRGLWQWIAAGNGQ